MAVVFVSYNLVDVLGVGMSSLGIWRCSFSSLYWLLIIIRIMLTRRRTRKMFKLVSVLESTLSSMSVPVSRGNLPTMRMREG